MYPLILLRFNVLNYTPLFKRLQVKNSKFCLIVSPYGMNFFLLIYTYYLYTHNIHRIFMHPETGKDQVLPPQIMTASIPKDR